MPLSFRIFPRRGLVVVRYEGEATVAETLKVFGEYAAHPDFAPGQKQLVDLSRLQSYEKNYVRIMQLQAAKADHLNTPGTQSLVVYLAPTPAAQEMTALIMRSWEEIDAIVPVIQHSEAEALAILGQPETTVDMLMGDTEGQPLK